MDDHGSRFEVERRGDHVATVAMVGPAGKAVMDASFFAELARTLQDLAVDETVRAVVLHGSGPDFSYGLDLAAVGEVVGPSPEVGAAARQELLDLIRTWQEALNVVARCPKPVIAAISGWCVGGGVDLATACDIRIASADAIFSVREVKMAIVADLGSLQRLVGIVGDGHLRELAMTGGDIDADRAAAIGLVNHVAPDAADAVQLAVDLATRISDNSPLVLRGIKDVLDAERGPRIQAGLRYTATWNAAFLPSADLAEATAAFKERRVPRYTGS